MSVNGKIQSLNTAIRESIPAMRDVARNNPHADVLVRAVRFSSGACWHIAEPTDVDSFVWTDLTASGVTDLGQALELVIDQLDEVNMSHRGFPPVLVLVSDGQPTDDYVAAIKRLSATNWGKRCVRLAIAIGQDADCDVLRQFIGNSEIEPLQANNPEDLVKYIKWVSTSVVNNVSSPASSIEGANLLPLPPTSNDDSTVAKVW